MCVTVYEKPTAELYGTSHVIIYGIVQFYLHSPDTVELGARS